MSSENQPTPAPEGQPPANIVPPASLSDIIPAATPAIPKDSAGAAFDPSRHLARADGTPVVNRRTGRFMPVGNAARKTPAAAPAPASQPAAPAPAGPAPDLSDIAAAAKAPEPVPEPAGAEPINPAAGKSPDRFTLLADVYTRAGIAGAMGALGEEWSPDDDAEFVALRESVAAYLRATNREDLSPGWALTFAVMTYGAKRLPRPKTQSRLAFFREKITAWWRGRSVARTVASLPPAA